MNYRLLKNIRDIQFTVKLSKRWWQKKSMDPCQKSENFARENHQIQPQTCFFFTWNAGLLAYLVYRSRKTFYIWRFFDILKKCMKNVLFNQNYEVLWCEYLCQKGTNLKNLNWQFQKVLLAKWMNNEKFSEMMNAFECPYVYSTMCKFKDCPTTQFLREIKFGNSWVSKTANCDHFTAKHFGI